MFKLAVIILFLGAAAASRIATLPAIAPVVSPILPATTILPGVIRGYLPRYYGAAGNVIDGIDSLGLAYNNYDLNDGRLLGLGVGGLGGLGVGGLGGLGVGGLGGLGYGIGGLGGLGYGIGGLGSVGYGLGGLRLGNGVLGLGKLGGLGLSGVKLL